MKRSRNCSAPYEAARWMLLSSANRSSRLESSDAASSRFRGEVLSQVTEAVIATDNDGRIIYINDAAERQYGIDTGTVLNHCRTKLFICGGLAKPTAELPKTPCGKRVTGVAKNIHVKNDGSEFYAESTISLRRGDDGEVAGQLSVIRDVGIRKKAEEQLRRNHETFFNLVKNAPLGIYVVDADFRLIQVSAGSRKVFSFVDPLIGRDFEEVMRIVWAEPFASEAIAHFRHTLETGEPYRGADTTERRGDIDDEESYDWKIERITLPDGRFGVVCYFYDLTERKQFEQKIRESEERLSLVVEERQGLFDHYNGSRRKGHGLEFGRRTNVRLHGRRDDRQVVGDTFYARRPKGPNSRKRACRSACDGPFRGRPLASPKGRFAVFCPGRDNAVCGQGRRRVR